MIVAMPVKSVSADSELVPYFGKAKQFAIVSDKGEVTFLSINDSTGGRDVARTLIANEVDTLIVSHLGFNPYVLLKSYGIKVYREDEEHMTIDEAVDSLQHNKLPEVTPANFDKNFADEDQSQRAS